MTAPIYHPRRFLGLFVCHVCVESSPYGSALGGLPWVCVSCVKAIRRTA